MGSVTSNTARIKQTVTNDFLSVNENNCVAYANQEISGNTINIAGDFNNGTLFNQSGSISAACTINQQITQTVTSILSSQAEQVAKTNSDFMNGFSLYNGAHNTFNTNQTVTNNIASISANTCNATINSKTTSNVINVGGSANNINAFNINTNQTATCTINNTVDQEAYNHVQAKVQQSATTVGMFTGIITIIVIGIIICSVASAIIYGITAVAKSKNKKDDKPPGGQGQGYGQQGGYGPYGPQGGQGYGQQGGYDPYGPPVEQGGYGPYEPAEGQYSAYQS